MFVKEIKLAIDEKVLKEIVEETCIDVGIDINVDTMNRIHMYKHQFDDFIELLLQNLDIVIENV